MFWDGLRVESGAGVILKNLRNFCKTRAKSHNKEQAPQSWLIPSNLCGCKGNAGCLLWKDPAHVVWQQERPHLGQPRMPPFMRCNPCQQNQLERQPQWECPGQQGEHQHSGQQGEHQPTTFTPQSLGAALLGALEPAPSMHQIAGMTSSLTEACLEAWGLPLVLATLDQVASAPNTNGRPLPL